MLFCEDKIFVGYMTYYCTGNGTEATLTDFASVVGEICSKRIIKISTGADSCLAIAGIQVLEIVTE